jgi:hypothetical protein
MTDDPIRLLDDEGSPLLKSLISAGREEEPHAAALRRTLAAVGVAGVLSTTSAAAAASHVATAAGASGTPAVGALASGSASASAAATSTVAAAGAAKGAAASSVLLVAKWLAIGALTGTVASSAVYGVSGVLTPAPAASSVSRVETTPSVPQVLPPQPSVRDELREIPAPPPVEVVPSAPAAAPAPVNPEPSAERRGSLAAEVTALDGARQALGAGDAARTLELLDGYEVRFREPRMLPEVLYLRLEAFTLRGERSSAEAVARRIVLVYPTSPHAARARAVLGLDK